MFAKRSCTNSVAVQSGAMQLTRTLRSSASHASALVSRMIPAFAAAYSGYEYRSAHHHVDHPRPFLGPRVGKARRSSLERVVDEDVEAPELRDCGVDHPSGSVLRRNVDVHEDASPPGAVDLRDGFEPPLLVDVRDDDVRAVAGQGDRHGPSDPGGGSGDNRDPILDLHG
jgi:hypothetical protein